MTSRSLFVDLTDTATQRDPAPTYVPYVISASVLKTPLATVLRPVAPLHSPLFSKGWLDRTRLLVSVMSPRSARDEHQLAVVWEISKLAFEQLMRLAELVTTVPLSVSM